MKVASDPGNVFNLHNKSFTFEGWFQHQDTDITDSFGAIIGGTRNSIPFGGWLLKMGASGNIEVFVAEGSGSGNDAFSIATSGTDYRSSGTGVTFHHFALVWQDGAGDNSTGLVQIYIDGVLEASMSAGVGFEASVADSNDNSFIMAGRDVGGGTHWTGRFDEFRFSDQALSSSQFLNAPEPGSLALLSLGGLCVLRRRRG